MILDPQTTLFISRTFIFVSAIAMFFGAWQHRETPGLKIWGFGFAAMALANVIWVISEATNAMMLGFGNFVAIVGFILFWQGTRAYQQQPEDYFGFSITLAFIGLAANFYFSMVEPIAHARYIASAGIGVLMTAAACYTFAITGFKERPANLYLAVFFAAWCLYTSYKIAWLIYHLYSGVAVDATQNFISTILVYALLLSAFSGGAILAAGQRANEQLRQQADTDPQTGVYNRRAFDMAAGQALDQCARRGAFVSVLMISLDRFQPVQQRFGQSEADELLKKFAELLQNTFRAQDVLARMSGKEFCVFMPETNLEAAKRTAERTRQKIENGAIHTPEGSVMTASIGVSGINAANTTMATLSTLIEHADFALYRAKQEGRNQVQLYELKLAV